MLNCKMVTIQLLYTYGDKMSLKDYPVAAPSNMNYKTCPRNVATEDSQPASQGQNPSINISVTADLPWMTMPRPTDFRHRIEEKAAQQAMIAAAGIITSCMNFLQTGRMSFERVAENIITCFSCGVARNISWMSLRMSVNIHIHKAI